MKAIDLFLLSGLLVSCLECDNPEDEKQELTLSELYAFAVTDARDISENEIVELTNIKGEECCIYRNEKIKMVTWIPSKDKAVYLGGNSVIVDTFDVWGTVVPELKDFCLSLNEKEYCGDISKLELRLEQILGLPITTNNTHFVEFWVDTSLVYRPTINPRIDELILNRDARRPFYREWFNNQLEKSFDKGLGYPWTRLGYTYDWSRKNGVGLSEFVVIGKRDGSVSIEVEKVIPTDEYCGCFRQLLN